MVQMTLVVSCRQALKENSRAFRGIKEDIHDPAAVTHRLIFHVADFHLRR